MMLPSWSAFSGQLSSRGRPNRHLLLMYLVAVSNAERQAVVVIAGLPYTTVQW